MVRRIAPAHDVEMHTTLELSHRDLALAASAHELQRAAEIACASSRDWTRRLLLNPPQPETRR